MAAILPLSVIILAAGASSRMKAELNKHKLALRFPHSGKTLLQTTLESYLLLPFLEILLILPADEYDSETHALTSDETNKSVSSIRSIVNPATERGMAYSLALGIKAASPEAQGFLIALGDMPFIRPATIEALCNAFFRATTPEAICVPYYQRKRGNPVLFGRAYSEDLQKLQGDTGAKSLLEKYEQYVISLQTEDEGILRDIDTKEDWLRYGTYQEGIS